MALSFIAKKAAKKPIGTHVEVTLDSGDSLEKVTGIITDSDFETGMDITTYDGKERSVDFSLIKGFQEIKSLEDVLKGLSVGTMVRFSYGDEENKTPNISGTVSENDGMEGIEIVPSGEKALAVEYYLVRSLLVLSGNQQPQEKKTPEPEQKKEKTVEEHTEQEKKIPEPHNPKKKVITQEELDHLLNANDGKIKETFDVLPKGDRQKLNNIYERFKYGVKMNDRPKMAEAANQARRILFTEDDDDYLWSREAVLFTGYLLRRSNIYDPEVLLIGECFEEAAYAAWKISKYNLAGSYAIIALLENTDNVEDMVSILTACVIKGEDISGLRVFSQHLPAGMEAQLQKVIAEAFSAKGIKLSAEQDTDAAMTMLSTLYPNTEMGKEAEYWLPKEKKSRKHILIIRR